MKRIALTFGMFLVSFLFISHGLYAQRIDRYGYGMEDDIYDLNLTREQLEKIDKLELELEKELSSLFSKLRSSCREIDELEAQRTPDPTKINQLWDVIYKLEDDIRNKEIAHEDKIRDILTEDQRAVLDSDYGYDLDPYSRGYFGRGYLGRGFRRFGGRDYGYGRYSAGIGARYLGRGAGRLGHGYYGYGRGLYRDYARNRGYFGLGAGRFSGPGYNRYYPRLRYGRGSCGLGLGRWYR